MPRTSERGGPQTRARIAEVAAGLFLERGFDAVTVAEVARAAGVSSVTVFNHFPRKEDLFLDRSVEAADLLISAVRDRDGDLDVLTSLQRLALTMAEQRHALSGLRDGSAPFFRTVAGSPALLARAREIAFALQQTLAAELEHDAGFAGDPALLAALFMAGYAEVLRATAHQLMSGGKPDEVAAEHRDRLDQLFDALRHGVPADRRP